MLGYGDRDKTCAEWTDGCLTCRRAENGDQVCSNIGPDLPAGGDHLHAGKSEPAMPRRQ